MIEHKIVRGTPDEVCKLCSQCYEDECRAYSMPHGDKERIARTTGFGMECDAERLKQRRWEWHEVLYKTPKGKFDRPYTGESPKGKCNNKGSCSP